MKFFDKTLDEIFDIVADVNEQIFNQLNTENEFPTLMVTFEFCEWWAGFNLEDIMLFSTENNDQAWIEETDTYEDLKITLIRAINNKLDNFKKVQL